MSEILVEVKENSLIREFLELLPLIGDLLP
jgi:hypothetical protein